MQLPRPRLGIEIIREPHLKLLKQKAGYHGHFLPCEVLAYAVGGAIREGDECCRIVCDLKGFWVFILQPSIWPEVVRVGEVTRVAMQGVRRNVDFRAFWEETMKK